MREKPWIPPSPILGAKAKPMLDDILGSTFHDITVGDAIQAASGEIIETAGGEQIEIAHT